MAGPEKRGPRRGRGPSKRPRESEEDENTATRDALKTAGAGAGAFSAINFDAPTGLSSAGKPGDLSGALDPLFSPLSRPPLTGPDVNNPPRGKVAIPSIKPRATGMAESSKTSKKNRTTHACDVCRKAKAGCTGGTPCRRCGAANLLCVYGDGKREQDRK